MAYKDLTQLRETYVTLRDLVIHHPGGWDDAASRAKVERLCDAATLAADDLECRERLRTVVAQARDLYSPSGHLRWGRSKMSGSDYLRLQMLIALEALNTRLFFLEAMRQPA